MTIFIRQHADDCETLEMYTVRKTTNGGNQFVLFGTAHVDILDGMNFDWQTDELCDYRLVLEKNP
jgi:hypothetical protein